MHCKETSVPSGVKKKKPPRYALRLWFKVNGYWRKYTVIQTSRTSWPYTTFVVSSKDG